LFMLKTELLQAYNFARPNAQMPLMRPLTQTAPIQCNRAQQSVTPDRFYAVANRACEHHVSRRLNWSRKCSSEFSLFSFAIQSVDAATLARHAPEGQTTSCPTANAISAKPCDEMNATAAQPCRSPATSTSS